MKKIRIYQCTKIQDTPSPAVEVTSESMRSSQKKSIKIDAAEILTQYQASNGDILLVLDEDSPYEEQLHFVLIRDDQIIGYIKYGGLYTPGVFKEISRENDDLRFTFASDEVLSLTLNKTATRWNNQLPPGARYQGGWFQPQYLSLKITGTAT